MIVSRIPNAIPAAPSPHLLFVSDGACFARICSDVAATDGTFGRLCWHVTFVIWCELVGGLNTTHFAFLVPHAVASAPFPTPGQGLWTSGTPRKFQLFGCFRNLRRL